MLVCKFGGTSLADARCFERVAQIVRSDKRRRCIIVSAPGRSAESGDKVTDLLIKSARDPSALIRVKEIFSSIALGLGLRDYSRELSSLDTAVHHGRDIAASRGEWLCALMLSEYLGLPFVDAKDIFRFRNSVPDLPSTYINLQSRIKTGAVIPGFYGSDEFGRIVTFPRGGSDICGALAAAALNAEAYENWTDVNGFCAADPAIIPDAQPIFHMSYSRARILAMSGAGVLHWACIPPVQEKNIPIIIKNTFDPAFPGTKISSEENENTPCIAASKSPSGEGIITALPVSETAYARIFAALPDHANLHFSENILTVSCPLENLHHIVRLIHSRLQSPEKP